MLVRLRLQILFLINRFSLIFQKQHVDLALTQPSITTMTEYIQQYNDHPGPDIATTEKVTTSDLKDVDTNHRIRAARLDHHK